MNYEKAQFKYKFSWFDWFCLWYPPGWLILFNRHWQKYHADPDGWNWLEYILFLIPGGFYLALLIRWLRLGCRSPRQEKIEFNPNYQQAFRQEILAPIAKYYFRGELHKAENLPETAPLIVAMNHAGMCFPWDFLVLAYLLGEVREWTVQPLAGVSLFEHPWVIWWLPPGWSKVLGGVRAELDDFAAAVSHQIILLYAPEGLRGPSKGWFSRYQLETFHPSFINLSDRSQIPISPIICLGNESLHPWTINIRKLGKIFGLPFLPISFLMPVFLLFPSMGIWAMKTRMSYYVQPVCSPSNTSDSNHSNAYRRAQELRDNMQKQILVLNKFVKN
jgi:1-acyl-sn-glycerol-3-phosphate acyltransferase